MKRGARTLLFWGLVACSMAMLTKPRASFAAPLTLTFKVTIRHSIVGSVDDPAGMDGATVSFNATFADGAIWQNSGFGSVFAVADSHSFTIAGASVTASNGTYSDPNGFVIESSPGVEARFGSPPFPFDSPVIYLDSRHAFVLGFNLSPVPVANQPGIGDSIEAFHFATTFKNTLDQDLTDTLASSTPTNNFYEIDSVVSAPDASGSSELEPSTCYVIKDTNNKTIVFCL